jgi:hypothetical protein
MQRLKAKAAAAVSGEPLVLRLGMKTLKAENAKLKAKRAAGPKAEIERLNKLLARALSEATCCGVRTRS